ncbi:hypothetical protein COO60DRAFT_863753 [Scenedesmus sp. NREL 46B-D3]|nr:hypothetical protein COO60DRAFT_863753 [Scenedesmus sp. NREL 46B-D3]
MPAPGHLLADVGLGSGARSVAWCPVNGIVAVGSRVRKDLACVHLLNVHCVSRKVTLYVPLQGPADDLVTVAWSPAGCRRVLLTATLSGKLTAWTQQAPEPSSQTRITVEDWWCHDVADLAAATAAVSADPAAAATAAAGQADSSSTDDFNSSCSQLVAVRWLQPVSSWAWNSSAVQQADYQAGSMHDMFAQPSLAESTGKTGSCKPDPAGTDAAAAGTAAGTLGPPAAAGDAGDQPGEGNCSSSGTEGFHWVRTGALAFTAVMSCGAAVLAWAQWSAYGQLSWVCTSGMALPAPAAHAGKLQVIAADAMVCAEGVAVAYALQQQPNTVAIAQLQGNPLHAQFALLEPSSQLLPVVQAGSHSLAQPECCVTALSWDQCSNSGRLACVSVQHCGTAEDAAAADGSGGAILTLLNAQQGQVEQQAQAQCAAAVSQQQLVWLLDGVLLWSGGDNMQLFTLDPLQEAAVSFAAPAGRFRAAAAAPTAGAGRSSGGRVLCALAASPHGVGVAAVMQWSGAARGSSSNRLLLYNAPPAGAAADSSSSSSSSHAWLTSPKPVAARLLWALMQQKHTWDVVQHTLCASRVPADSSGADVHGASTSSSTTAAAAAVQPDMVGQVLSLVDAKLAVQQPTLKSTFSARWDVLKLAVLSGTPGDVARVVGIDLRLRIISHMMKPVFDVMREVRAAGMAAQGCPGLAGLAAAAAPLLGAAALA